MLILNKSDQIRIEYDTQTENVHTRQFRQMQAMFQANNDKALS